eukprot:NODE_598_length_1339_cov_97.832508_g559_i0.p1 GENE.NODE_598_length_1339_cov_97.832508_g559_i0~~NODE_598_length_1339_cov_97.832508_g559_i0.p1  ORF type:complete len:281 (+),score=33.17 NODE_598_length_1339_cov_97.832508_g559_i0:99-941(+)
MWSIIICAAIFVSSVDSGAYEKGITAFERGEPRKALELWQAAIAQDPGHPDAPIKIGSYYESVGQRDLAMQWFRNATRVSNPSYNAFFRLGSLYMRAGDYDEAEPLYRKSVDINGRFSGSWADLGHILEKKQDFVAAYRCYRTAIRIDPNFAAAQFNLGMLRERHFNDTKGAIRYYFAALRADPKDRRTHFHLGTMLLHTRNFTAAETVFRSAVEQFPDNELKLHLAMALAHQQKSSLDAILLLEEVENSNPTERDSEGILDVKYALGLAERDDEDYKEL